MIEMLRQLAYLHEVLRLICALISFPIILAGLAALVTMFPDHFPQPDEDDLL